MFISISRVPLGEGRDIVVLSPWVLSCVGCCSPHRTRAMRRGEGCFGKGKEKMEGRRAKP